VTGVGRLARLDDIVSVHLEAFPGFFMAQLGPGFLRQCYACVVDHPRRALLTGSGEQGCTGFVLGLVGLASHYRERRRRRVRLGLASGAGIVTWQRWDRG
jgi:hypothetical protein